MGGMEKDSLRICRKRFCHGVAAVASSRRLPRLFAARDEEERVRKQRNDSVRSQHQMRPNFGP